MSQPISPAFDHRAKSGYARGEGAGCLILKPLHKALEDGDYIRAVISHTGISHNGRTVGMYPQLMYLSRIGG